MHRHFAAGRSEHRQRVRPRGGQAARDQSAHRQDRLHRRNDHRPADHAVRLREHHSRNAGIGWQVAEHLLRRRDARGRRFRGQGARRLVMFASTRARCAPVRRGRWCRARSTTGSWSARSSGSRSHQAGRSVRNEHADRRPGVQRSIREILSTSTSAKGRRKGAGRRRANKLPGELAGGYYIKPTVFKGHNKMRVFQEEIFGPVVSVTTFDTPEQRSTSRTTRCTVGRRHLDPGPEYRIPVRQWHQGRTRVDQLLSRVSGARRFGGYKKSGIGRETHKMMLDHYQQTKNVLVSYSTKALGFF